MEKEVNSAPEQKNWFSDLSWKSAVIIAALSFISGGTGGAGVMATKAVKAEGMSVEQSDLRYATKEEIERRAAKRDTQFDDLRKSIVTKDVFDERTRAIQDEQARQRILLEKLLEK